MASLRKTPSITSIASKTINCRSGLAREQGSSATSVRGHAPGQPLGASASPSGRSYNTALSERPHSQCLVSNGHHNFGNRVYPLVHRAVEIAGATCGVCITHYAAMYMHFPVMVGTRDTDRKVTVVFVRHQFDRDRLTGCEQAGN
jgi:hypothetical protein